MKPVLVLLLTLLLTDCTSIVGGWTGRDEIIVRPPDLYTRSEIDALNAEIACRNQARTMLQVQRCDVRR
jgi:hypothetical protein